MCEVAGALDRAKGALVGLALGDALGTTLEFSGRDTEPPVTDLVGGGPFRLAAGEWTDDTSMALCLADSLLERGLLDVDDVMERFLRWYEEGHNSVTGECFDIGATTAGALHSFRDTGEPLSGGTDPQSAGNGSLMRLSPVAIRWWHDRSKATAAARLQSRTTHGAPQAVEACALYAELLVEAIAGAPKETVLRARDWSGDAQIAEVAAGSWRAKERDAISSSGYVLHTLEAALWCVGRSRSIEDALILAANLAGDADTVAAVTGQLAGALWGMSGAPAGWSTDWHGASTSRRLPPGCSRLATASGAAGTDPLADARNRLQFVGNCCLPLLQIVVILQPHPESRRRAEELRESKRRVSRDPASLLDDVGNGGMAHAGRLCKAMGRDVQRFEELLLEHLSGMNVVQLSQAGMIMPHRRSPHCEGSHRDGCNCGSTRPRCIQPHRLVDRT